MNTNLEYHNKKNRLFHLLLLALLLISSAFSPIFSATAQSVDSIQKIQTEKNLYSIVVIGDSLAVGYENGFTAESKPFGVGEQLYEQALFQGLRATYTNYGIIGLTSSGLLRWLEAAQQNSSITANQVQAGLNDVNAATLIGNTPQLKQDLIDAKLIVVAIGGNDFLKILSQLDLKKDWSAWTQAEREELQATLTATTEQYEQQLKEILSIVYELNSSAQFVTQNQYLPLPKASLLGTTGYIGIEPELAELLKEAQAELNHKFDTLLDAFSEQKMSIQAIDAAAAIESSAGSLTSIIGGDPHPNENGYKKLSQKYSELIWGEYREVQKREEHIPLSVVVNGEEVISPYPTKLIEGRTFLVLRDITEAMGAEVTWDNITKTATIAIDDRVVQFTVGAATYNVNGKSYTLNAEPAFLAEVNNENKTYIPVAALSEGLDFFVEYQAKTKIVFINK